MKGAPTITLYFGSEFSFFLGSMPTGDKHQDFYLPFKLFPSSQTGDPSWDASCGCEIGESQLKEIKELIRFVADQHGAEGEGRFQYRPAPSKIVRDEAETLGLSDPRFGYRLFWTHKKQTRAVITLRRTERFRQQAVNNKRINRPWRLAAEEWIRTAAKITKKHPVAKSRRELWDRTLGTASPIADSILRLPQQFTDKNKWYVLEMTDEAAAHYGEALPFSGVPYMKHIKALGGGMCVQACCWMATMLTYHLVSKVHSPAEITFLARTQNKRCLDLGGMTASEAVHYFNDGSRELSAAQEVPKYNGEIATELNCTQIEKAAKSYLASGFPVLLSVDLNRMAGKFISESQPIGFSIYRNNGVPGYPQFLNRPTPSDKSFGEPHRIILIGCEKGRGGKFLFQDPAVMPFLSARMMDLLAARTYLRPNSNKLDTEPFALGDKLAHPEIIPVLPKAVRLRLLRQIEAQTDGTHVTKASGLIKISEYFINLWGDYLPKEPKANQDGQPFLLKQIGPLLAVDKAYFPTDELFRGIAGKLTELVQEGWGADHWIWLQVFGNTVWIWDAEANPNTWDAADLETKPSAAQDMLIGVGYLGDIAVAEKLSADRGSAPSADRFQFRRGTAKVIRDPKQTQPDETKDQPDLSGVEKMPVKVSVISSFCHLGLTPALHFLNGRGLGVDLYSFMRSDAVLQEIQDTRHQLRPFPAEYSVCEWLARNAKNHKYIKEIAERIVDIVGNRPCPAVATFIPELTATASVGKRAHKAFQFLFNLVGNVNALIENENHRIKVIELVAGGLLEQVIWRKRAQTDAPAEDVYLFEAHLRERATARRKFHDGLRRLVPKLPPGVYLAVELEPGPLFLISNEDDLVQLATSIKNDPRLAGKVGFNLDIAHWSLAGITPASANKNKLLEHVIHAHASHVGRGHFSDLEIGTNQTDFFQNWLKSIEHAYSLPHNHKRASGHVSVELELPESFKQVARSADLLLTLV